MARGGRIAVVVQNMELAQNYANKGKGLNDRLHMLIENESVTASERMA